MSTSFSYAGMSSAALLYSPSLSRSRIGNPMSSGSSLWNHEIASLRPIMPPMKAIGFQIAERVPVSPFTPAFCSAGPVIAKIASEACIPAFVAPSLRCSIDFCAGVSDVIICVIVLGDPFATDEISFAVRFVIDEARSFSPAVIGALIEIKNRTFFFDGSSSIFPVIWFRLASGISMPKVSVMESSRFP